MLGPGEGPRAFSASTSSTIDLKKGVRAVIGVTGAEGGKAPLVDLVQPNGSVLVKDTGELAEHLLLSDKLATTYFFVTPPVTGTYRLVAREGTIAQVNYAEQTPKPRVIAAVTGSGATRTVNVQATTLPGQRVTLYEEGGGNGGPIGVIKKPTRAFATAVQPLQAQAASNREQVTFRPNDPDGAKRKLVAIVEDADGTPRARYEVATFRAPKPPPLPRPRLLRARIKGSTLVVRWVPGRGAKAQQIDIRQGNGTRIVETLGAKASRFVVHDYPITAGARISVTAQTAKGESGPTATTRVAKRKAPKRKPLRI